MAKSPTYPLIIDRCHTVSIGDIKRWGCLNAWYYRSGKVYWERGSEKVASVGYTLFLSMEPGQAYIQFNYTCNGNEMEWRVPLLFVPSNLGKGIIWFFRCRVTGKRCKKLHLIEGRFMHRSAVQGAMYKQQTISKEWRKRDLFFDAYERAANLLEEADKPYLKEHYRGKPTRRYARLIRKAEKVKRGLNMPLSFKY